MAHSCHLGHLLDSPLRSQVDQENDEATII